MTLPSLIRKHRKEKNWSQQDVADRLGVTTQFICQIEKNKSPIPPRLAGRCLVILDLPEEVVYSYFFKKLKLQIEAEIEIGKKEANNPSQKKDKVDDSARPPRSRGGCSAM